ncbi:MAG TPA: SDR family oxidoreductase [Thermoanaerobaculia bacterium]|nr:SDR family oxidoreductase [Thermoanaerobaculia bacterium]
MANVLVTGHKGYIGAVLVPMLIEEGFRVAGLDVDFFGGGTLVHVPEIDKDLRDVEQRDLAGFDAVIHLAALSNDPLGDLDPALTYDVNYRATVRLAALAKAAGVPRFLFSSSCSNYGAAGGELMTERSALNPVTPYGKSKVMAEEALRGLADGRFSPVFLRNATAYGVSPRLRCDLVVNNLAAWAFTTGRMPIRSDGTPWRPLVHVRDIAAAFIALLRAPRDAVHNETFNVGRTEENYRVRDVAAIIAELMPGSTVEYANEPPRDSRDYRVSCDKIARRIPLFRPEWSVRRGVAELLDAYAKARLQAADIEGPRFTRMACIRRLLDEGEVDASLRRQQALAT